MFRYGIDIDTFFDTQRVHYNYYGTLNEIDFLKRIYDLKQLPSFDGEFCNAEDEIYHHTIVHNDYDDGWILEDKRFELLNGEDDIFLRFLCSVFHPMVRYERGYWKEFLNSINGLLRADGYELFSETKISERDVYGWRRYDPEAGILFLPFSQRNAEKIKSHKLMLSISMKAREQIYALLEKTNTIYHETTETGWHYTTTTSAYVFREISQFYEPKCFDESGNRVATDDMKQFILRNLPTCVFDAIELHAKNTADDEFSDQVNAILKINGLHYRLEQGQLKSTVDPSLITENLSAISEKGLRELLSDAEQYYCDGNKQIAVEKLWDAFERLKTYYSPNLNKPDSANKIIKDMSASDPYFQKMYATEFQFLTYIGNHFRIRHHETTTPNITDIRQYDYFYKRCHALISVAILYLDRNIQQ